MKRRVLISTIKPMSGGVPISLKFAIDCLRKRQYEITIAYYEPYSQQADLSVPLFKLPLLKRPGVTQSEYLNCPAVGIGAWLPELEFTHYWPTRHWRTLIREHDIFITVSGSVLPSLAFHRMGVPFLSWVASDWKGDREHRAREFPIFRKLVDRYLVAPVVQQLEKSILRTKRVAGISQYTKLALNSVAGQDVVSQVQSIAIDSETFSPVESTVEQSDFLIGFSGRFEDQRKNIDSLLFAFSKLRTRFPNLRLKLMGDEVSHKTLKLVEELKVDGHVDFLGLLPRLKLVPTIQSLDLFVVPSHQEGLCISALEAMSCAVPVVATRCGGPESFIEDGVNGVLCDVDAESMAAAISHCLTDREARFRYAKAGRATIERDFSIEVQTKRFLSLVDLFFKSPAQQFSYD